jgi:hypothetical protein
VAQCLPLRTSGGQAAWKTDVPGCPRIADREAPLPEIPPAREGRFPPRDRADADPLSLLGHEGEASTPGPSPEKLMARAPENIRGLGGQRQQVGPLQLHQGPDRLRPAGDGPVLIGLAAGQELRVQGGRPDPAPRG